MLDRIYEKTGLTATVGIGTNLYLAKIAMDISAKHNADRMAYLNETYIAKHYGIMFH